MKQSLESAIVAVVSACAGLAIFAAASSVASAQENEINLADIRSKSIPQLRLPEFANTPHYVLICIGQHPDVGRWLVTDGATVVYFDQNGDGNLTDEHEKIESFDTEKLPPGTDWDEQRIFKIGVIGNIPLTLNLRVRTASSPLRPTSDEQRNRLRELQGKHDWQIGSLQSMAGAVGRQNVTFLFFSKTPQDAQVVWIDGLRTLRFLEELIGQQPAFDLRKRIRPGSVAVRVGTPGLSVPESPLPSFSPADPSQLPTSVFPRATINFNSGPVSTTLSRRIGGGAYRGQFDWPVKVEQESVEVTVNFDDWKEGDVQPLSSKLKIEF